MMRVQQWDLCTSAPKRLRSKGLYGNGAKDVVGMSSTPVNLHRGTLDK